METILLEKYCPSLNVTFFNFQSIVSGFLMDFPQDVRGAADAIVSAR